MTTRLVKACLNGDRRRDEHPAIPISPEEIAADARAAERAGAGAVHFHPRGPDGAESLHPEACGAAVRTVRDACPGLPLGISTGAWIEPDLERRLELIRAWDPAPDFASVNLSEEGAPRVMALLLEGGIGVEAGLWRPEDVDVLAATGLAQRCLRVLVEPHEEPPGAAVATAAAIAAGLSEKGIGLQRVHHGYGPATWAVIDAALRLGDDVRVGFEDTLVLRDGSRATGNAELVAAVAKKARA